MYHKYIKRFFDIILSLCCIIVSSPILLVIALLVRIKLGSPVIFKQERPGYHNEIFTLYKFRSMTDAVDENGDLLPDKERLPRFGQMLRSTSLDELPEFFNILFGHMSFVGPRPLLKQYIDFYSARQKRRADVRPGLTGLAQVNGRNAISWEEKFEFDLEYVDNISFLTDIKIILKTVTKVLKRAGISAQESVTMYAFQGTKKDQFSKYKKAGHLKILFSSVADQVEFIDTFRYFYPDKTGAYSWWSYMFSARKNNAGWRIDYFLVSDALRDHVVAASIYDDVEGSDHCPVGLELDI